MREFAQLKVLAQHVSQAAGLPVHIEGWIESSNQSLLQDAVHLPLHPAPPCALIALQQTAGRGRRGRAWVVDAAAGSAAPQPALLASLGVRSQAPLTRLSLLPLHIGVAVVEQLRQWGCAAQLKWPNDIVIDTEQGSAKLGGILVETRSLDWGHEQGHAVVMGLGLNWHSAPQLADRLTACVTAVAPRAPDAVLAAGALLGAVRLAWQRCSEQLPCNFSAYDALFDAPVVSHTAQGAVLTGIAKGVNAQGHLGVQTDAGLLWLHSGEVSVRAQP